MALIGAIAAVAATSAVGCLVAALWLFVLPSFGPAGAALIAAGALGLLSLVLIALALVIDRRARRRARFKHDSEMAQMEASRLLNHRTGAMLLGALVAGLAAGSAHRD
jgi:hypothetical protein